MKSIVKAKEALSLAEKEMKYRQQAEALHILGQAQRYLLSDFDKALEYSFQALKLEETHKLEKERAATLTSIAEIYKEVGNNYKALEFYMQSLVLQRKNNSTEGIIVTMNDIGLIYMQLNEQQKALEYFQKALAQSREQG